MFKGIIKYILNNIFKINTETTDKEIDDNSKYAKVYADIDDINFNAIFSNKLANYTISDSNMNIEGDNKRADRTINVEESKKDNFYGIWLRRSFNSPLR